MRGGPRVEYDGAGAGAPGDQSTGGEGAQRLADRAPGDAEALRQLPLRGTREPGGS
ncbi:hypothetical protein GCM10010390_67810 [Streptomyces mordarskii]|uniref:Uncharacterized protein n=1 Tax=Streptomyces mordarskii TaxID=1226758 RepID=A0ABP3NZB1_9ACTN